jgi:hypothetical protein
MGIIKNYHDKKWTIQFLDVLYNSIDIDIDIDSIDEWEHQSYTI